MDHTVGVSAPLKPILPATLQTKHNSTLLLPSLPISHNQGNGFGGARNFLAQHYLQTNDTSRANGLAKGLTSQRGSYANLLNSALRSPREDYQGFNVNSSAKKIHDRTTIDTYRSEIGMTPNQGAHMKMRSYSTLSQVGASGGIMNETPYMSDSRNPIKAA